MKGFESRELWRGAWLFNSKELNQDDMWIEGSAVFENHIVGSAWTIPNELTCASLGVLRDRWARSAHGSACMWRVDAQNCRLQVLPDLLGAIGLHVALIGPLTLVSTSARQIELWAKSAGKSLTKSVEYQAERILLGNAGLVTASFEEMERLPPGQFLSVWDCAFEKKTYPLWEQVHSGAVGVEESFELVREDLLNNIETIAHAQSGVKVAHLTGGFDSRLILAATLEAGVESSFLFFTSGPPIATDRAIADGLSRRYGLTQTQDSGLKLAPPRDIRDRFLTPMRVAGGMMSAGPMGREPCTQTVAVGGGYGELLRSFFGKAVPDYNRAMDGNILLSRLWGSAQAGHLIKAEFRDVTAQRLRGHLDSQRHRGVPENFDLDYFYLTVRNRYHIGLNAASWSQVGTRLDPLYSPYLVALAMQLSPEERASCIMGFKFMDSLVPELRHFRFDHDRYDQRARALMPRHPIDLPTEGALKTQRIPGPRPHNVAPLVRVSDEQKKRLARRANAMKVNYWQLEMLPLARQALRRVLRETDLDGVSAVFDVAVLESLAHGKVEDRRGVRSVYSSLEALLWLEATV